MILAVWLPLLIPLAAAPAARRLAAALPPGRAAWLLAGSAAVLALCSTAALGLLAGAGALRLPPVAALGHLVLPVVGDEVTVPAACGAAVLLTAITVALVRTLRGHVLLAVRARRVVDGAGTAAGDLIVLDDPAPDAYALPGLPGRPGRIVVTAGMLRALDPAEREALLAHERAHLAGRHHVFLAVLALACACHPAFRVLREPLSYALERCADEAAAGAVGDRRVTARAIGRAALAGRSPARPEAALPAAAGPVPRRVAALLHPPAPSPVPSRGPRLVAVLLFSALSLSALCALDAAYDLHGAIEVAQAGRLRPAAGEPSHPCPPTRRTRRPRDLHAPEPSVRAAGPARAADASVASMPAARADARALALETWALSAESCAAWADTRAWLAE